MKRFGSELGFSPRVAMVLALAGWLGVASASRASTIGPSGSVTVDGQSYSLRVDPGANGTSVIHPQTINDPTGGWSMIVSATMDPDPSITYFVSVTNYAATATNFSLSFFTPIVQTPNPTLVSADLSGTLADAGNDGAAVKPIDGSDAIQDSFLNFSTPMGVSLGTAKETPGIYGPFAVAPKSGPAGGPWSYLTVTVNFSLTGGRDTLNLLGEARIVPDTTPAVVPEPSTLRLLGLGAMLVVARSSTLRRRRVA